MARQEEQMRGHVNPIPYVPEPEEGVSMRGRTGEGCWVTRSPLGDGSDAGEWHRHSLGYGGTNE
jgi:hypothetical protein